MAKDNITYPSLITLNKSFQSEICNQLVFESPIGIESEYPDWILYTGFWRDTGEWVDKAYWKD